MDDYTNMKNSDAEQLVREKIRALKENGHLPKGYAKIITERYPEITKAMVYNATKGKSASDAVQNAIIELATENKAAEKLRKLDAILNDD
jgi:hypothetical protein